MAESKPTKTPTPEEIADKAAKELIKNKQAMSLSMLGESVPTDTKAAQR
jgi:hypothetical protein